MKKDNIPDTNAIDQSMAGKIVKKISGGLN